MAPATASRLSRLVRRTLVPVAFALLLPSQALALTAPAPVEQAPVPSAAASVPVVGASTEAEAGSLSGPISAASENGTGFVQFGVSAGNDLPPATAFQPTAPYYGTFYYPWFKNAAVDGHWGTWDSDDNQPSNTWFSHYLPDPNPAAFDPWNELYSSRDPRTIYWQLQKMAEAKIEFVVSSWWGPGTLTDQNFRLIAADLMNRGDNPYPNLRWTLYYEEESHSDPTVEKIVADLNYIADNYANQRSFFRVGGKPVIFVYATGGDREGMVQRWMAARNQAKIPFYVVLKLFSGYADVTPQPDSWHQYGPGSRLHYHAPHTASVSPGFWHDADAAPTLVRDPADFRNAVQQMVSADATWKLVTTWNEWGEGTGVEPAEQVVYNAATGKDEADPAGVPFRNVYVDTLRELLPPLEAGTGASAAALAAAPAADAAPAQADAARLAPTEEEIARASGASFMIFQPTAPFYGTFYYAWYKNAVVDRHWGTWNGRGNQPSNTWFSHYLPDPNPAAFDPWRELYSSRDAATIYWQLRKMADAKIEFAASSWWGPGKVTDNNFAFLIKDVMNRANNPYPNMRWTLYYEEESTGDPSVEKIVADLNYIADNYAFQRAYFRIDRKPVIFVYGAGNDREAMVQRWMAARSRAKTQFFIVLKLFSGYKTVQPQPDSWHQYGPSSRFAAHAPYSASLSPGFWHDDGSPPALARDPAVFYSMVRQMIFAKTTWKLLTTWNEWGEGTGIEPAQQVRYNPATGKEELDPNGTIFRNVYIDILKKLMPPLQAGTGASAAAQAATAQADAAEAAALAATPDAAAVAAVVGPEEPGATAAPTGTLEGAPAAALSAAPADAAAVEDAGSAGELHPDEVAAAEAPAVTVDVPEEADPVAPPAPAPAETAPAAPAAPVESAAPAQPAAGAATGFSFGAAGDFGFSKAAGNSFKGMAYSALDFTLVVGDLSYSSSRPESEWCAFVKQFVGDAFPVEVLVGNHEDEPAGEDGFIDRYAACLPDHLGATGLYAHQYFFDYPAGAPLARFILIDADSFRGAERADYCSEGDTANCDWLKARIDEAQAAGLWTIVAVHKNCFTMGGKPCEIGAEVMNVMAQKKVDLVIQGHDHGYQRSKQIALGAGCAALEEGRGNTACIVDEGGDDHYTRGAGMVWVISAAGGVGVSEIDNSDPDAAYVATWMKKSAASSGWMKFTVTPERIDAQWVGSKGYFDDAFAIAPASAPACAALPTAGGVATMQVNVSQPGAYHLWSRMAAAEGADTYWVQVDDDCPVQVQTTAAPGSWQWVEAAGLLQLDGGMHTVRVGSSQTGVRLDKLLLTAGPACAPSSPNGAECVAEGEPYDGGPPQSDPVPPSCDPERCIFLPFVADR